MYLLSPRKATWNHLIQYMSVYDILIHQTLLTLLFKGHHCCFSLSASHLSFHPIYSDISRGTKINQWGISRHHQTTYLILGIWLSLWLRTTSWSIFRKTHDSINFALYWMFLGSPLATFWCHWWAERISFFGFLRFSDHSISTPFLYQYYNWVSNQKIYIGSVVKASQIFYKRRYTNSPWWYIIIKTILSLNDTILSDSSSGIWKK